MREHSEWLCEVFSLHMEATHRQLEAHLQRQQHEWEQKQSSGSGGSRAGNPGKARGLGHEVRYFTEIEVSPSPPLWGKRREGGHGKASRGETHISGWYGVLQRSGAVAWAVGQCAAHCVNKRLKTPFGRPAQTLKSIEEAVIQSCSTLISTSASGSGEKHEEVLGKQRVKLIQNWGGADFAAVSGLKNLHISALSAGPRSISSSSSLTPSFSSTSSSSSSTNHSSSSQPASSAPPSSSVFITYSMSSLCAMCSTPPSPTVPHPTKLLMDFIFLLEKGLSLSFSLWYSGTD